MTRSPNVRTKIARAILVALVPLTICVQGVLAHASPIVQTFRNGVTLTSFSGTFEVIWPCTARGGAKAPPGVVTLSSSVEGPRTECGGLLRSPGVMGYSPPWKGGRVVEGTALEKRQVNSLVGSNPTLSATL